MDQPGPSTSRWDAQKSSGSSSSTEKENTNIGGFQILKMNSTFITSFTAGYELPCHSVKERFTKRIHKRCFARRLLTHPYHNSSVAASTSDTSGYSSGSYRLRTTSLSSGTSKNKTNSSCTNAVSSGSSSSNYRGDSSCSNSTKSVLVRSRSMENLSASMADGLVLTYNKPRELETVSSGIQRLKMDDCT